MARKTRRCKYMIILGKQGGKIEEKKEFSDKQHGVVFNMLQFEGLALKFV